MRGRNTLSREGSWRSLGNFLLNFGVAIVWLGRWTIRLVKRLGQKGRG